MAEKVKKVRFDYIAHIQKEDGTILELEGTRDFATHNDVFTWLRRRSHKEGGWLISQHIEESNKDESGSTWGDETEVKKLPAPPVQVNTPSVFADTSMFGEYKRTYTGALLMRFLPRSEES